MLYTWYLYLSCSEIQ